jgi:deoxyribonuclease V
MMITTKQNLDQLHHKFIEEQNQLAGLVNTADHLHDLQLIAGVDVSYSKDGHKACAAIVLLRAEDGVCVEQVYAIGSPAFPYKPQLLAFRELPLVKQTYEKLTRKPDLFFYDGNGLLHQRKFGAASHFGVKFDVPVIGCAKNPAFPTQRLKGMRGDVAYINHPDLDNDPIGVQLITQDRVKPVYISIGHKVSLDRAIKETLEFSSHYRLPEPIRLADQLSRSILKDI